MKAKTKQTLGYLLSSNFKNQSAIEASKMAPWWIGLIMVILAIFLPVIPLMVNVASSRGSSIIQNQTFALETHQTGALLSLSEDGYSIKVDGNNKLIMYHNGEIYNPTTETDVNPVASYISTDSESHQRIEFQIYMSSREARGNDKIATLMQILNAEKYINGTTDKYIPSEETDPEQTYYRPSYLLLFKDGIRLQLFKHADTKVTASVSGDWITVEKNVDLIGKLLNVEGTSITDLYAKDSQGKYLALRDDKFTNGVLNNFKDLLDVAFKTTKNVTFWTYTFVFLGVYALLVLFMGLMIFLLTRGKNNPMNYITFWAALKITFWAAFAPGLLAMILGFMLPQWATMFFILLFGMRTMWISMKQMRPDYSR